MDVLSWPRVLATSRLSGRARDVSLLTNQVFQLNHTLIKTHFYFKWKMTSILMQVGQKRANKRTVLILMKWRKDSSLWTNIAENQLRRQSRISIKFLSVLFFGGSLKTKLLRQNNENESFESQFLLALSFRLINMSTAVFTFLKQN